MKLLLLHGSARKDGNTSSLASLFVDLLREAMTGSPDAMEMDEVRLGHADIRMCRGCRICFDEGEDLCPLKDDVLAIREKMRAADLLVLTSPVYVGDVSGIVKNWIDRMAFACHRPEFGGKRAVLLGTTGSMTSMGHMFRTMSTGLQTWGYRIIGKGEFPCGALMSPDGIREKHARRLEWLAGQVARALSKDGSADPSFLALLTFAVQQRAWSGEKADSVDLRYWKDSGWLDPARSWYLPHDAPRLKVLAARAAGSAISGLFM